MMNALLLCVALGFPGNHLVRPGESIQAAIDRAVDGDRVVVLPGRYIESIDLGGKAIELIGRGGAAATTIVAVGGPVVTLHAGESADTVLRGFTLTGGRNLTTAGGGIAGIPPLGPASQARVEDCVITGNNSLQGGGIAGNLAVTRCLVTGNLAGVSYPRGPLGYGGGIYGAPVVRQSAITNNSVNRGAGGGVYFTGPGRVEDCVVTGNDAWNVGGGVLAVGGASVTIVRSLLADNRAIAACLGYCGPGGVAAFGAAIYAEDASSTVLENCTVIGNTATWTGATPGVGGLFGATVSDSIVRGNAGLQLGNALASFCNVEGGAAGTGIIDADPLFVDAAAGDYHLTASSPCIDAGNPARTDPDGSIVDLGAFPYSDFYAPRDPGIQTTPGWTSLSAEVGGAHPLRVHLGSQAAGRLYLVLGSVTGTAPGVSLFGATLPLIPDPWFAFTLARPNSALLASTFGVLDANGTATANLLLPPGLARPLVAWHAALVLDPGTLRVVATRAVRVSVER